MPQVDPGAHDPRPVLDRRGHPVRGLRLRLAAAPALHGQHLVLGRDRLHRRDVDDLPPLDRGDRRVLQGLPAAAAPRRPVPHLLVRVLRSSIVAPGWPFGLPGLRPDLPRSDFGAAWPARPTTAACWSCGSSSSPARPGPRPATAALPAPRGAPRSPRPAPRSARPAPPAAPAAACSQREARHHRCRERRASRARTNAATTPPRPQIGRHRSGRSRRENAGDERESQTDLSSYKAIAALVILASAIGAWRQGGRG